MFSSSNSIDLELVFKYLTCFEFLFVFCVCVCVPVPMCMQVHTHVMCMDVEVEVHTKYLSPSTHFLRKHLSPNLDLTDLTKLAPSNPRDPPVSVSPALGLQAYIITPGFSHGRWRSNSLYGKALCQLSHLPVPCHVLIHTCIV